MALPFGLLVGSSGTAQAQQPEQQSTISGRVTDQATGQALQEVRIVLVGRSLVASTNQDGRYTLRGVPAGANEIRALRIGYVEQKKSVTVTAGQQATLDFAMTAAALQLSEVVTTATGTERRLEVGNQIDQIQAAAIVATQPIKNMADLLTARAPGVQVLPGTQTGMGSRVRIRGAGSLSLSNEPIYIIDGVRMQSSTGSGSIGVGGSVPDRVGDINPNDIENIEVVKGPSAATLYGTDAANGVIVITTKRGRAGHTAWNAFAEGGIIQDNADYFSAYTTFGHAAPGFPATTRCFLTTIASGACVSDSLKSFNLFKNKETTPLTTGNRQQYGLSVSGGSEAVRFFVSGTHENEVGVLQIPQFDVARLNAAGVPIRDEWMHPNQLTRTSLRANMNVALTPQADLAVSTAYTTSGLLLPQNENNGGGLTSSAYGGPGYRDNGFASGTLAPLNGYRSFTPGDIFQNVTSQGINRFIGSANANYRPTSWLSGRANVGIDFTDRVDEELCRRGTCPDLGQNRLGFRQDNRTNFNTYSFDGALTASFQPRAWLSSKSTGGVQYVNDQFERNGAGATNLPPGATTATAGAVPSASEASTYTKTLGAFVEQTFGFRDRVFVTGALRADDNSAFGSQFKAAYYPKVSASWILSDEPFFPKSSPVSEFRLRAAYGSSGTRPGSNDALRYFAATTINAPADATSPNAPADRPGVTFSAPGNKTLRPETATELELGFDTKLFRNRIDFSFSFYDKSTKDALIARVIPVSVGSGSTTAFENLAKVRNRGFEGNLTAQVLDRRSFGWDVSLNGSTNNNKLVSLGGAPPIVGSLVQEQEGYPLFGWWERKYTYSDANKDHIITLNEIKVDSAASFVGNSAPRYEAVLTNGFDLFNKRLRIQGMFDYKGGYVGDQDTERIRCQSRNNCRAINDPTAPLWQQARAVALRDDPSKTQYGYLEDGSFVRFRELSVTVTAPERLTRLIRANSTSLTFAGRNLHVWTKYSGLDPESTISDQGNLQNDFQAPPPPTYFTLRFNIGF